MGADSALSYGPPGPRHPRQCCCSVWAARPPPIMARAWPPALPRALSAWAPRVQAQRAAGPSAGRRHPLGTRTSPPGWSGGGGSHVPLPGHPGASQPLTVPSTWSRSPCPPGAHSRDSISVYGTKKRWRAEGSPGLTTPPTPLRRKRSLIFPATGCQRAAGAGGGASPRSPSPPRPHGRDLRAPGPAPSSLGRSCSEHRSPASLVSLRPAPLRPGSPAQALLQVASALCCRAGVARPGRTRHRHQPISGMKTPRLPAQVRVLSNCAAVWPCRGSLYATPRSSLTSQDVV